MKLNWLRKAIKMGGGVAPAASEADLMALRQTILGVIARIEAGAPAAGDLCGPEDAEADGKAAYVAAMMANPRLHEPDYAVFGRFTAGHGTILDVGANWGYSVGSIRASGSTSPILSFEVLPAYRDCLEAVKRAAGGGYDYIIAGVGERPAKLDFYTPVVNGVAITALTSARPYAYATGLADHIAAYARDLMRAKPPLRFSFMKTATSIETIDSLLAREADVPRAPVAAIKIDVEGLEAEALAGAAAMIGRDRPFLLIEGGNRPPAVKAFLDGAGYASVEFVDGELRRSEGYSASANGLFVHASRLAEYAPPA